MDDGGSAAPLVAAFRLDGSAGTWANWRRISHAPQTILNTDTSHSAYRFAKWPSAWPKALQGPGLIGRNTLQRIEDGWLHFNASKSLPTGSFRVKA